MKIKYAIHVYRDTEAKFRWRVLSKANANNLANSSEGYERAGSALAMVQALFEPQLNSKEFELQLSREVAMIGELWLHKHWPGTEFVIAEEN